MHQVLSLRLRSELCRRFLETGHHVSRVRTKSTVGHSEFLTLESYSPFHESLGHPGDPK